MVRGAIVVGVRGFERVVDTVVVSIGAGGGVNIYRVIDTIVVSIITCQCRAGNILYCIGDTVVVAIEIKVVRSAVTIGVAAAFSNVGDAVAVRIEIEMIGGAIGIGVGRFERIVDTIIIGISAEG